MEKFSFEVTQKNANTPMRLGVIHTAHGDIQTPSFVPVGTQATVKGMTSLDLKEIGTQVFFVNTYHVYLRPGLDVIGKFGGLHKFMGWDSPLMTDSAGFQVFSLGDVNRKKRLRVSSEDLETSLVKISDEGVIFRSHLDGSEHIFTPEKSIEAQSILGADIMIAFDECTYYPSTHEYADKAMQRTHRWAERCLDEKVKGQGSKVKAGKEPQALYGVVQGGVYEDLRKQSAKYISDLPFEGIAVGGVAVGESKEEMINVLDWVIPNLPDNKPRHLLGVGEIDDIFEIIEKGIDSFDCVIPTRLARMGFALTKFEANKDKFLLDLNKAELMEDKRPIDDKCECFVCKNHARGYLHHLFRAKELLAYRLATYHNLYFMEEVMRGIRQSIKDNTFNEFKSEYLKV